MTLATYLDYPIIAIADLHGQLGQLKRLVEKLENVPVWDKCALVFLGDFVDRGEDVPGTVELVLQLATLHRQQWDRSILKPQPGSATDRLWKPEYPVWLGADKGRSESPLPFPGKVQVTGHVKVSKPDVNSARICLDTSGGSGHLTARVLHSKDAEPVFISSDPK